MSIMVEFKLILLLAFFVVAMTVLSFFLEFLRKVVLVLLVLLVALYLLGLRG